MSFLVPNQPVTTGDPTFKVNSRELGFGVFHLRLRVEDDSGNRSAAAAHAVVVIERGPAAVAVLRAPPLVLEGRPVLWYGAESYGTQGLKILEYRWSLRGPAVSAEWKTRTPTTTVGGPALGPADPIPRDLAVGRYRAALVVTDDSGGASEPHEVTFTIARRTATAGGVAAVPIVRVNEVVTDTAPVGAAVLLDASGSLTISPGTPIPLRSFLWTWFPVASTTPEGRLWDQRETPEPRFRPDWLFPPGLHRFRLVATDARGQVSAPADAVLLVVQ